MKTPLGRFRSPQRCAYGNATERAKTLLNSVLPLLRSPTTVPEGMTRLLNGLTSIRRSLSREQWLALCDVITAHAVMQTCQEDPFTQQAYAKPRGYAGDAVVIDYLYQEWSALSTGHVSPCGLAIMSFMLSCRCADSVRWRRDHLAAQIDVTAIAAAQPEVLSVACGHFREGQKSRAVLKGLLKRVVAIDQDIDSLAVVRAELPGVETIQSRVQTLLKGDCNLGRFDLIYAAGLYDYLADATAHRLTINLFAMLKPGGRVLIANFLPGGAEAGYMDSIMGWRLNYRTCAELEVLACRVTKKYVSYLDPSEGVAYIQLTRST